MSRRRTLARRAGKLTAPWFLVLAPQAASARPRTERGGWARELVDALFDGLLDALFRSIF